LKRKERYFMKEEIIQIEKKAIKEVELSQDIKTLEEAKVKYLGKKGELTAILRGMGALSPEERPVIGSLVNEVREKIETVFNQKEEELKNKEMEEKLKAEKIDITLPSTKIKRGSKHPINRVIEEVEDIFVSMGYDVVDGPELETDEYCFERLNLPKGHPARDMQDSFYVTTEYLLRTQTSSVQARTMMANEEKTPIRMICPGKTYRRDDDATHSHQFGQVEGLVIDKNISLADLKGTLEIFVKKMLGENSKLRFRPSYFPFTEPSYEVDVSCFKCGGKGCNLCKQTGWIEILGSGMVHPNVLKMNGYDPEVYTGFAFGTGLDRLAMFKYGITDIRLLYTNDIKFLSQFDRKDEENEIKY
jgi:phenylalanyl-tRNA synthetase alpha chain